MSKGRVGKDIAVREDLHRLYDRVERAVGWTYAVSLAGWTIRWQVISTGRFVEDNFWLTSR